MNDPAKPDRPRWRGRMAMALGLLLASGVAATGCVGGDERPTLRLGTTIPDHGPQLASALFQNLGVELESGHRIDVLQDGAVFDAIVDEIATAEHSIHVLVYIWDRGEASDRIVAAIRERARRGVECRIVVDAFGSNDFFERVAPELTDVGCEARAFRPDVELERNHRKIVVVDGRVAFTGGFGIRDEWLGNGRKKDEWRDTAVRFRGPAVIDAQQAFAENWIETGGALLPAQAFPPSRTAGSVRAAFVTSTGSDSLTRAERLVQVLISAAHERLWIANAYFVPSDPILELLQAKADAGVDVRVLTAGTKSDSKTSWGAQQTKYDKLADHGVRVWEYEPTMMHGKTIVVDDQLSMIGTINIEPLSLRKLEENALVIEDRAINEQLARAFVRDCEHAKEQGGGARLTVVRRGAKLPG